VAHRFMGSPAAPRPTADVPNPFPLGLGEADAADPSSLGSGEADAPDPLPLSSSSASCRAVDAPSPGGLFHGRLMAQLAQAEYSEGDNPRSAYLRSVLWGCMTLAPDSSRAGVSLYPGSESHAGPNAFSVWHLG
jgi:hypothetical protein